MIREITDLNEAFHKAMTMPWAYVASDSQLILGCTPRNLDWSKVLDARFFSPFAELRIFRKGDTLSALWVDDTPCPGQLDAVIDRKVDLTSRFGKTLQLRQHIVFDEDGQAGVFTTRLVHWKGVEQNDKR